MTSIYQFHTSVLSAVHNEVLLCHFLSVGRIGCCFSCSRRSSEDATWKASSMHWALRQRKAMLWWESYLPLQCLLSIWSSQLGMIVVYENREEGKTKKEIEKDLYLTFISTLQPTCTVGKLGPKAKTNLIIGTLITGVYSEWDRDIFRYWMGPGSCKTICQVSDN